MIPNRLKLAAATGLLIGGLGVAALPNAFAAPLPDVPPAAAAATPVGTPAPTTPTTGVQPNGMHERWGRGASMTALAGFFGISATDLQTQLSSGQTLAQIATAHGKTTDELKTFLTSQLKTRLDAAVTAGKITSQQEQDALTRVAANLDTMINAKHTAGGSFGEHRMGRGARLLGPVAGFLGMQVSDLKTALQSGQTLSQVAQAHGKTAADLKAFLLDRAGKHIDTLMNKSFQKKAETAAEEQAEKGTAPAATSTATPNGV
jgi:hypothetical protein